MVQVSDKICILKYAHDFFIQGIIEYFELVLWESFQEASTLLYSLVVLIESILESLVSVSTQHPFKI